MPTKNPRVIVTLEPALYAKLKSVARANGTGLSAAAHDLISEACEDIEDFGRRSGVTVFGPEDHVPEWKAG